MPLVISAYTESQDYDWNVCVNLVITLLRLDQSMHVSSNYTGMWYVKGKLISITMDFYSSFYGDDNTKMGHLAEN